MNCRKAYFILTKNLMFPVALTTEIVGKAKAGKIGYEHTNTCAAQNFFFCAIPTVYICLASPYFTLLKNFAIEVIGFLLVPQSNLSDPISYSDLCQYTAAISS